MKKQRGLVRNRYDCYLQSRQKKLKKVHRFKNIGMFDNDQFTKQNGMNSSSLLSTDQSQPQLDNSSPIRVLYESINSKLQRVQDINGKLFNSKVEEFQVGTYKRFGQKNRIASCISNTKYSKSLKVIPITEGNGASQLTVTKMYMTLKSVIKNLQISLGSQLRELTKTLRQQQRQYFNKIKIYQEGTHNKEIELTESQIHKMKDWEDEQIDEEIDRQRDEEINKLVSSINGLTKIYKQMADLVLEQGTIIDRIDYNIDKAVDHTEKGVEHLRKAQQRQSSAWADRCIQILVGIIIVFAVILGFKYSH